MEKHNPHIAIIGAGLSGCVLSQRLTEQDFNVTLFEKSAGTGGRMASSRLGEQSADLGAPYLQGSNPEFCHWLDQQPTLSRWQPVSQTFSGESISSNEPLYTAHPRQSALTRSLIENATLQTKFRIGYLWPELEDNGPEVLLRDEHGTALGNYDAAIVTTPAPQAIRLLEAIPRFAKKAEQAEVHASWVVALQIECDEPTAVDQFIGQHPILARCIKDSAKPGRELPPQQQVWLLEANSNWSKTNKDTAAEDVQSQLISCFSELLPFELKILQVRCHRWLYARHSHNNSDALWDKTHRIGACGDWLESGDILGAWVSANKLADKLIADLR